MTLTAWAAGGPTSRRSGDRSQTAGAVGQHSLLVDSSENNRSRATRDGFSGNSRHRHRPRGPGGADYSEWVQSLEDMIGTGAGQLMQQVFTNIQGAGAPTTAPVTAGSAGGPLAVLQNLLSGLEGRHDRSSRHRTSQRDGTTESPLTTEAQMVNQAISNPSLIPHSTIDRWNEESAIFCGGMQASERITLISRRITSALTPDKIRRDQEQQERQEKEKLEQIKDEESRATEENEPKSGQEGIQASEMPTPVERMETAEIVPAVAQATPVLNNSAPASTNLTGMLSDRPSWRERVERRRQAQAAAQAAMAQNVLTTESQSLTEPARNSQNGPNDLTEVLNLADRLSSVNPVNVTSESSSPPLSMVVDHLPHTAQPESIMSLNQHPRDAGNQPQVRDPVPADQSEIGSSRVGNRVMIEIRGNQVDITDTGIDPEFLEALPDDMREEQVPNRSCLSRELTLMSWTEFSISTSARHGRLPYLQQRPRTWPRRSMLNFSKRYHRSYEPKSWLKKRSSALVS